MINRNAYILLNSLTMSPYQSVRENQEIIVNTSLGAFTVILPNNGILGSTLLVIDATGNASTNNITIQANNAQINGNPTYTLDVDYGIVRFIQDTLNNDQCATSASGGGGVMPTPTQPDTILASDGSAFVETDQMTVDVANGKVKMNGAFLLKGYTSINTTGTSIPNDVCMVDVDSTAGAITVFLPLNPEFGTLISIKDTAGTSSGNPITINGNGKNIDGSSAFIIAVPYEAFSFWYNNTEWQLR